MATVNYIKCDICGRVIDKEGSKFNPSHRFGTRFLFGILNCDNNLDICDDCIKKLKYLKSDLKTYEDTIDHALNSEEYKNYDDVNLQTAFLYGVECATNYILSNRKLETMKGDKR